MIGILEYGMGNLGSVLKGIEKVGGSATICSRPEQIAPLERLIVPGVGAFGDAMDQLTQRGLVEPLTDYLNHGRPFLGICLGMQLLFTTGFENGERAGLGVLGGQVKRFDFTHVDAHLKIPHMGWNSLSPKLSTPMLDGVKAGDFVYFVHSFHACPDNSAVTATETEYGYPITSAVTRENLFATQFHPEKSQKVGLQILSNFVRWKP